MLENNENMPNPRQDLTNLALRDRKPLGRLKSRVEREKILIGCTACYILGQRTRCNLFPVNLR